MVKFSLVILIFVKGPCNTLKELICKGISFKKSMNKIIFRFQTQSILERHLKIGEKITAQELVEKTKAEGQVSMLRGSPGFKFVELKDEDGSNYTVIQWEDLEARLIRPNLGIIFMNYLGSIWGTSGSIQGTSGSVWVTSGSVRGTFRI